MPDLVEGLSQALLSPPIYLLRPDLQPELLSGSGSLPAFTFATSGPRYGAVFSAIAIPPYLGRELATPGRYHEALLTLSLVGQLNQGGQVLDDVFELHAPEQLVRFSNLTHARVDYWVLPGVTVAWSYLIL